MRNEVYQDFAGWLKRVNCTNRPQEDIVAYNFGLFQSANGYLIYLTGSRNYDPENDDWACTEDYIANEKYFELPKSFVVGKKWEDIHGELVLMVAKFIESPESKESFLSSAAAITVGFDDGDLERVK